ncbi:uncharacterized protein ACMZJ9_004813 [Mantella aurantiaca]
MDVESLDFTSQEHRTSRVCYIQQTANTSTSKAKKGMDLQTCEGQSAVYWPNLVSSFELVGTQLPRNELYRRDEHYQVQPFSFSIIILEDLARSQEASLRPGLHCSASEDLEVETRKVLLALSVAVLVIFTVAAVLRVSKSSNDPSFCDTYLKRLSVKYFLQATRHQIYLLQALAAFILINSYLLLHINQIAYDFPNDATDNDSPDSNARKYEAGSLHHARTSDKERLFTETVAKEKNILEANSSDIQTLPLLPLSAEKLLTYLAFYGNFAIPLTIYAIQESEQLWKKEKLWGLLYSFILLLSPLKYLSSTLTFYIISVTTHKSPQNLLFEGVSKWLPSLYVTSVLSLFLFTLALKIYIELRLREPALSCGNIIVRREIRYYPLGVILTSVLILGCEIPYISHFIFFILNGNSDILIVYLLAFSIAFCFVAAAASLVVGFKKNQHATKSRIKKKRVDSGVCLVNSFVYQARSEAGKAEC